MIQWKLGCRSRKQKRKTQPIARPGIEHCHWFILPLLLATPTMQFSLDRKRRSHKQNQCSASDSVGLIFTRSYRFTLLITTPSLVKTSLKGCPRMLSCLNQSNIFASFFSSHVPVALAFSTPKQQWAFQTWKDIVSRKKQPLLVSRSRLTRGRLQATYFYKISPLIQKVTTIMTKRIELKFQCRIS